jgi:ADP-heptose:LPS heptosyltransferase
LGLGNNARGKKREYSKPFWLGIESLENKTIFVYSEQGMGDIIQFSRYLPELKKLGCKVIFEVPKKIVGLFDKFMGADEILISGEPLPSFDFYCSLMSLPLALKTNITNIPKSLNYIHAPATLLDQLRHEIKSKTTGVKKLVVGISWHSNAKGTGLGRSINLKQLIEGINNDQMQFVNLQYGDTSREIDEIYSSLGVKIIDSSVNTYDDLVGLAALIEACDIVISIDNTTVHLAGALGKTTFVLLPLIPDWRWLLNRIDSPWYPSLKLFRQSSKGVWNDVLEKIKTDLQTILT